MRRLHLLSGLFRASLWPTRDRVTLTFGCEVLKNPSLIDGRDHVFVLDRRAVVGLHGWLTDWIEATDD